MGDVIDRLSGEGHETAVVIALSDALEKRQLAYDRDPDPEEEEPSNEWPAIQGPRPGQQG